MSRIASHTATPPNTNKPASYRTHMLCTYEVVVRAVCPVDDSNDEYNATLESPHQIMCERIVEVVRSFETVKQTQEQITEAIAIALGCKVTTVGYHSGVRTTVVVGGRVGKIGAL